MSETLQLPVRRGITERDVWMAVDAVVTQGRRPTIDAVRQQLGRGSPNTIQAHLDSWFAHLGERLGKGGQATASTLPPFLAAAASHLWEAALSAAREVATGELQDREDVLVRQKTELEAGEEALRQREVTIATRVEAAQASAQQAAEERAAADRREGLALERAGRLESQIVQLTAELDRRASELRDVRHKLEAEQRAAAQELAKIQMRMEGQERHWLGEVERARGDANVTLKARSDDEARHRAEVLALNDRARALEGLLENQRAAATKAEVAAAKAIAQMETLRRALGGKRLILLKGPRQRLARS